MLEARAEVGRNGQTRNNTTVTPKAWKVPAS